MTERQFVPYESAEWDAEVLAHHAASINVVHTLRPFIVVMAGANEFDPFKD